MYATAQALPVHTGAELISVDGRALPLVATHLAADACAGLCRAILTQTFHNPYAEPLEVHYQVPLPEDGAVSGYAFVIGDLRIAGRIERTADARASFERAIVEGRSAALLEQTRSSLFKQRVGNIPPGQTVRIEITVDQPLIWREGQWEWRFPTVVAPRYLGSLTPDPAAVTVPVADGEISARLSLGLTIRDARTGAVSSPSHPVSADGGTLYGGLARLDRDVVIRWPVALPEPGVSLDRGRGAHDRAYGLLSLVPPSVVRHAVPRDLIVLLDTSGSMGGAPLAQAKAITTALIDRLDVRDHVELIEFSTRPRRWKAGSVEATPRRKRKAKDWVAKLSASGGTEMRSGIIEALAPLRPEAQRQVILVTDGLLGFEHQIVREIRDRLPTGSRVHTVGIGHGVNRSLTGPAARAGAGVEVIVAPGEPVEAAVEILLARTGDPQVVDLQLSGPALLETAPRRLPDLFAAAPARIAVALRPEGGHLFVSGRTALGSWTRRVEVPPTAPRSGSGAVPKLFGRMRVADLEIDRDAGEGRAVDPQIEAVGLRYAIATRMTAWVAETQVRTVDPTAASRSEVMPHLLPAGMSAEGVGLRMRQAAAPTPPLQVASEAGGAPPTPGGLAPMAADAAKGRGLGLRKRKLEVAPAPRQAAAPQRDFAPPPPPAPRRPGGPADGFDGFGGAGGRGFADDDDEAPDMALDAESEDLFEAPATLAPEPAPALPEERVREEKLRKAEVREEGATTGAVLRGSVRQLTDARLVVAVTLAAGHAWRAGAAVTLVLADGRRVIARVDASLTTRDGWLEAGQQLRLALTLAGPLTAAPRAVELADGTRISL